MACNNCGNNGGISSPSTGTVDSSAISTVQTGCGCDETCPTTTQTIIVTPASASGTCCIPTGLGNVSTSCTYCGTSNCNSGCGCRTSGYCTCSSACQPSIVVPIRQQTGGINKISYAAAIKVINSFNMPAVNGTANLAIEALYAIGIGAIIYNENVGWLRVTGFNKANSTIMVQNFLSTGQVKSPGEVIDACTWFAVGVPDYTNATSGNLGQHCLEADFIVPAVNADCSTPSPMVLDNVGGVTPGDLVVVNGSEFVVCSIDALLNTLYVRNAGSGGTVGSVIEKDCSGGCTPVYIVGATSPCDNGTAEQGEIVICSGDDLKTLVVPEGYVPVGIGSNQVKAQAISVPIDQCTVLTASFTIDNIGTSFVATVADATIFTTSGYGSQVILDNALFLVGAPIDSTHVRLSPTGDPGGVIVYPPGLSICIASCCECLPFDRNKYVGNGQYLVAPIDISAVGTYTIPEGNMTFVNGSVCQGANLIGWFISGGSLSLNRKGHWQLDIMVDGALYYTQLITVPDVAGMNWVGDYQLLAPFARTLTFGETLTFSVGFTIRCTTASTGSSFLNPQSPIQETVFFAGSLTGAGF